MRRYLVILLFVGVATPFMCKAQKNQAAPPARAATKTITDADKAEAEDRAVTIGMELPKALQIFESWGLSAEETMTASIPSDPNDVMKEFIVRPQFESNDALYMIAYAKKDGSSPYKVGTLIWCINYDEDAIPKTMRANRGLPLESIDVRVFLRNEQAEEWEKRRKNPF